MRRIPFILLAAIWCVEGLAFQRIIHAQGLLIGGEKYFAHFGIARGIAAEQAISGVCFAIAALSAVSVIRIFPLGSVVRWLSVFVAIAVAIVYINFLGTIPVIAVLIHSVFPLYHFPSGFAWVPISTFFLSILTGGFAPAIYPAAAKASEESAG